MPGSEHGGQQLSWGTYKPLEPNQLAGQADAHCLSDTPPISQFLDNAIEAEVTFSRGFARIATMKARL